MDLLHPAHGSRAGIQGTQVRLVDSAPIFHSREERIEAYIFIAFPAYCLQVTLKHQLKRAAEGVTPRAALDKFKTMQMVDVHLPTTDGRHLILSRYTQPEPEQRLLLDQLCLKLRALPPTENYGLTIAHRLYESLRPVVKTFAGCVATNQPLNLH